MDILLTITFVIVFTLYCIVFKRNLIYKKFENTIYEVARLGNNIGIVGMTGAGKTTSGAAFVHILTIYLQYEIASRMNKIRLSLKEVDFLNIQEQFVYSLYEEMDYMCALECTMNKLFVLDTYYTDFLELKQRREMVKEYICYWFVLNIRKNFTYAKGYFFNRVSNQAALLYDSSSVELRNVIEKDNWQVDIAQIIFDDERSIERGNVLSSDKDTKLSGSIEFNALLRNMFRGLTFKIVIKQESSNEVKQERSLLNSNLEIYDRKDSVCSFNLTRSFLNFLLNTYKLPYRFFFWIFKKDLDQYLLKKNFLRFLEHKVWQLDRFLNSFGYIRLRIRNYFRADDVGKANKETYAPLVFYFPKFYSYGVIDTYEYNTLLQYYQQYSNATKYEEVSKFDEANRINNFLESINRARGEKNENTK